MKIINSSNSYDLQNRYEEVIKAVKDNWLTRPNALLGDEEAEPVKTEPCEICGGHMHDDNSVCEDCSEWVTDKLETDKGFQDLVKKMKKLDKI